MPPTTRTRLTVTPVVAALTAKRQNGDGVGDGRHLAMTRDLTGHPAIRGSGASDEAGTWRPFQHKTSALSIDKTTAG